MKRPVMCGCSPLQALYTTFPSMNSTPRQLPPLRTDSEGYLRHQEIINELTDAAQRLGLLRAQFKREIFEGNEIIDVVDNFAG